MTTEGADENLGLFYLSERMGYCVEKKKASVLVGSQIV